MVRLRNDDSDERRPIRGEKKKKRALALKLEIEKVRSPWL